MIAIVALTAPVIDGYGFDAGAKCSEKTARRGRAQLLKAIPCDLSLQAYCNLPGSLYPWNAVRRFVNENQVHFKMKKKTKNEPNENTIFSGHDETNVRRCTSHIRITK